MPSSLLIPAADVPNEGIARCDEIAYQYTAVVQPHAAMLIADGRTGQIVQASVNLADFLGVEHAAALGTPLSDPSLFAAGAHFDGFFEGARVLPGLQSASGRALLGRLLRQDGCLLLELENARTDDDLQVADPSGAAVACQRVVDRARTVEELAAGLTETFRGITGYDRCVIYRFDSAWNGEVIGESRSALAKDAYLGMRFPARDIPRSAREMMFRAGVRVTVDQTREVVPIAPRKNPITARDVDLTFVRARGAAGACRTFYGNMGVRSTLVIPLTVDGALWGMLSCHGARPLRPPATLDALFELVGRTASNAVARLGLLARVRAERAVSRLFQAGFDVANPDGHHEAQLKQIGERLHALIPSAAFLLRTAEGLVTHGWSLDTAEANLLLDRLVEQTHGGLLLSHRLAQDVPGTAAWLDVAAGALAVKLSSGPRDVVVWLRADRALAMRWAGDPSQGLAWSEAGRPELTPRSSFNLWLQQMRGSAEPWSADDVELAREAAVQLGLRALGWASAQASRSKSDFLANMSHEIRTPMTAILGYADLLETAVGATGPNAEAITVIRTHANHLLTVINDILDLSKIEAGKLPLELLPTRTRQLFDEVLGLLRSTALEKGLSLTVVYDSPVPEHVKTDPTRLRQILINLVGNALKFTLVGSVTVRVAYDTGPKWLRVTVVDTGTGMSPQEVAVISRFEAFSQADSSTTRKFGGTGLGLRISNQLAQMLGGRLTLSSRQGEGTSFSLTVPAEQLAAEQLAAEQAAAPTQPPPVAAGALLEGARLLVAEDALVNQKLLVHLLTKAGATVTAVANGQLAVDAVVAAARAGAPFAVVLMDMQMPELDGYAATRVLREQGHQLPIIALTAHAMAGDRQKCVDAGCSDYLTKPLDTKALLATCARWLRGAG